ncbi:MAG: Holliday junction resolvase RuvX [Candidatus Rhabdochlamydia sp.]
MAKLIGLDFGTVRIGIAISDERQIVARSLGILKNDKQFFSELKKILSKEGNIERCVLGLPLKLNGQDSPMTQAARTFAGLFEQEMSLPVALWDERLTSAFAEKALIEQGVSRKKRVNITDAFAAAIILQSYLDRSSFSMPPLG